jgi:hypothetical protein
VLPSFYARVLQSPAAVSIEMPATEESVAKAQAWAEAHVDRWLVWLGEAKETDRMKVIYISACLSPVYTLPSTTTTTSSSSTDRRSNTKETTNHTTTHTHIHTYIHTKQRGALLSRDNGVRRTWVEGQALLLNAFMGGADPTLAKQAAIAQSGPQQEAYVGGFS